MNAPIPVNNRNLVAACVAITVFGFAFGMSYPLLSLILESRDVSSDMIGINSAMMPIGILLLAIGVVWRQLSLQRKLSEQPVEIQ